MNTRLNGLNLAYDERGPRAAEPILFVHGFPLNRSMWQPQMDFFAETHRCIAPDLRGHGETTYVGPKLGPSQLSMDVMADDLAALLDHLRIDKAIVCGLSMGGYIAFAFWRRHASRISALILADTKSVADSAEAKANRLRQADMAAKEGLKPIAKAMLPRLIAPQCVGSVLDVAIRGMIENTRADEIVPTLHALANRPDSTPTLATINVPTLVVIGERDAIASVQEAQAMRDGIGSNATLTVIPSAGHMSNMEQPQSFNVAMARFLR
jgi:pimeloyl-ACP methyl ester carboxylesterase